MKLLPDSDCTECTLHFTADNDVGLSGVNGCGWLELFLQLRFHRSYCRVGSVTCFSAMDTIVTARHKSLIASTMSETRQFGELATQLVMESRRSTQTDTLIKYNDSLVRSIIREQRDLEKAAEPMANDGPPSPALLIIQTAINRNKRCLLAFHSHRVDRLRDMYWAVGGALPHILSNQDIRSKLSPHEVDYLRQYHNSVMEFRGEFSHELDITASITNPPKDLHVLVRVVRDCGVIQTELGSIDFQKGHRIMVRRADIEHLIVQGYLEEVS